MLYAQDSFAHAKTLFDWEELPGGVRVKGRYTLEHVQSVLSNDETGLPTLGFPFQFERDQIQSGSMLSKQVEDCLVLKNAEHPGDYFHFVFTARTTGNMTTIQIYRSGSSPLSAQHNKRDERKNSSSLFQNVLGALTKTDDRAINEEYDYYAMVQDVIRSTFGI